MVVLNEGESVTTTMLPLEILHLVEDDGRLPQNSVPLREPSHGLIGKPLAEIERIVIEETIAQNDGSITKAARVLEVSASTLYRKPEAWAG